MDVATSFLDNFTIFILAIFVGYHVVWNVTPALHTPLMAVTNAISGIILVGALIALGKIDDGGIYTILSFISVLIASINVFGGLPLHKECCLCINQKIESNNYEF